MNTINNPRFVRILKTSLVITIGLAFTSMVLFFFEFALLQKIKNKVPNVEQYFNPNNYHLIIHILLCLFMVISVILTYKYTGKFKSSGIALSILGSFSFICLFLSYLWLHEYYEEYYLGGWGADPDLVITIITAVITLLFNVFCLWTMFKFILAINKMYVFQQTDTNEFVFVITHYIGIVCGIVLLILVLFAYNYLGYYRHRLTPDYVNWIYMGCLIFAFPYLSMIIYWIVKLVTKKGKSPYDEKQLHDLSKSGLLTWLISIPLMSIFIFIGQGKYGTISGLVVFPFYIATTLLIFSSIVLISFKRT